MWEKLVGEKVTQISESEARRLLVGNCRGVPEALESLRSNPWGQWRCSDCTIRFNPKEGAKP